MRISSVRLRGFRNFEDAFINLNHKTLVIGYNDVGKTNFVYALRLLLDRTLADSALEPKDSDFYAYSQTHEYSIDLHITDVVEDCLVARLGHYLSDDADVHLVYEARRDPLSGKKSYEVKAGSLDALEVLSGRFYLKFLNMKVVEGKRDLLRFVRKERQALLEEARDSRTDEQIDSDVEALADVEKRLQEVNEAIAGLHYVASATDRLNEELVKLSYRHSNHRLVFGTVASNPDLFINSLELVSRVQDQLLDAGGDGRHNQIQLALWTAKNQLAAGNRADPEEVSVYCIEEPEAHLHPHQQRKLASYLSHSLGSQTILTTHSPQIVAEFSPDSLVRLYNQGSATVPAAAGVSHLIKAEVVDFGYRMNIIPAEAFFASAVLLVEGPSELLFFRALAGAVGCDLDRMNISILSVDGVGFDVYCRLLAALGIPFAIRTDNDIFKVPRSDQFRFAGVMRAVALARTFRSTFDEAELGDPSLLSGFTDPLAPPLETQAAVAETRAVLAEYGFFVAEKDLEHDLYAAHRQAVEHFTGTIGEEETVDAMKLAKATFMFDFLRNCGETLSHLADTTLAAPLRYCEELVTG